MKFYDEYFQHDKQIFLEDIKGQPSKKLQLSGGDF
jgi:hypothetical protein